MKTFSFTLYPFKLSTTHANRASLPTVTVMFGMGSANLGKLASVKMRSIINWTFDEKQVKQIGLN